MLRFNPEKTKKILTSDPVGLRVIIGAAMIILGVGFFTGDNNYQSTQLKFMLHYAPSYCWGAIFLLVGISKTLMSFFDNAPKSFVIFCSTVSVSLWMIITISGLFDHDRTILNNLLFVAVGSDIWLLSYNLFKYQEIEPHIPIHKSP